MNALYLECFSGISGDMLAGALLDLYGNFKDGFNKDLDGSLNRNSDDCFNRDSDNCFDGDFDDDLNRDFDRRGEWLIQTLKSLPIEGFDIQISTVQKSSLRACDFLVQLEEPYETHDADLSYLHTYTKNETAHATTLSHEQMPERNLAEITKILQNSNLTDGAKETAIRIFTILANAEAKVHGLPVENVHFHEVGAVDSIVDIAAIAALTDAIKKEYRIEQIYVSALYEGHGTVRCRHGMLPIPVPAVAEIARAHALSLHPIDIEGELVTPTGAAAVAALCTGPTPPADYRIKKIGIGAGKRNYPTAGIVRAMIVEESN